MIDDPQHRAGDEERTLIDRLIELRLAEKELTTELGDFRPHLERANRTARRAKIVAIAGCLFAVVGIIIGIGGWIAQVDANESVSDARRSGCIQANLQAKEESEKLVNGLKAFFPDPVNPTEREQAALNAYAEATKPRYRDCSKAGIKAYIENPPADPALDS